MPSTSNLSEITILQSHFTVIRLTVVCKKVLYFFYTRMLLIINNIIKLIFWTWWFVAFILNENFLFGVHFFLFVLAKRFFVHVRIMEKWQFSITVFDFFFEDFFHVLVIISDQFLLVWKFWGIDRIFRKEIILNVNDVILFFRLLKFFKVMWFEPFWSFTWDYWSWWIKRERNGFSIYGALKTLIK